MISTWFKKREVKTILAGFLLLYYIQAHTLTSKNVCSFSYEKDKLHFLNNWMTFKTGGYGGIILVMRNLKLLMYIKWISYICIQLVWKNLALILKITLKGKMHATCRCQAINHTVQSYIIHSKTSLLKWFGLPSLNHGPHFTCRPWLRMTVWRPWPLSCWIWSPESPSSQRSQQP